MKPLFFDLGAKNASADGNPTGARPHCVGGHDLGSDPTCDLKECREERIRKHMVRMESPYTKPWVH